jgi:hypothetical protein
MIDRNLPVVYQLNFAPHQAAEPISEFSLAMKL